MSAEGTRSLFLGRFWLRLWFWSRAKAIKALREAHPTEMADARRAWRTDARLTGTLNTPAWNTRGLDEDLALHDAADSLLGKLAE